MKRLVYSPSVKIWVKTDFGVVDLSPHITECRIQRKVNDLSSLDVVFRNPKVLQDNKPRFLFTQRVQKDGNIGPVFHPMDPITVVLERIAGKPIQAFTGYCDTVPYVQLFPGTARLTASCTLKRLNYTYFDPGLPFVMDFMNQYGWQLGGDGIVRRGGAGNDGTADPTTTDSQISKAIKSTNLNDSSIGYLLYAALNEIGGWDNKNVYIQSLPDNIAQIVGKLFDEFAKDNKDVNKEIVKFVKEIIGNGDFGKLYPNASTASGGTGGSGTIAEPDHTNLPIPQNGDGLNYWEPNNHPKIIVLHVTEGSNDQTLENLKNGLMRRSDWADSVGIPNRGISVQVGIDKQGNSARYVNDENQAHHAGYRSKDSLGIEHVGQIPASVSTYTDAQINKSAEWVAYWSTKWNIPLVKSTTHGVCGHGDLGAAGGGGTGCPGNFPIDRIINKAKELVAAATATATTSTTSSGLAPHAIEQLITQASNTYHVDKNIIREVMRQESSFDQNSVSSAGAIGLMQLMPATAQGLGVNPHDAEQNVMGGAKYLANLLNSFNNNIPLALAGYNAGPGKVSNNVWKSMSETVTYVQKICAKLGITSPV